MLIYFLQQELLKLDYSLNTNIFTSEDKDIADSKLDHILNELKEVKLGQQVTYDDVKKELEELRNLYYLGKKNWHQLLGGKVLDMTMSGVVSETASKSLIDIFKNSLTLIG